MCISHDDQFLISVGEDGTMFTFRIIDKEGRMMKRERESNYAEEILITRSDLEEKVRGGEGGEGGRGGRWRETDY